MGEMEEKGEIGEDLRSGSKDKGEKYAVRSVMYRRHGGLSSAGACAAKVFLQNRVLKGNALYL